MIRLEPPSPALLPGYVAALRTGWSPSNLRDVSSEHLAAIEQDPAAFLADYVWAPGKTATMVDGTTRPRLPGQTFWIADPTFCGFLSWRYQPGTTALPPHVLGHVGYGIVPWKRRQGIATAALHLLLPIAKAAGLNQVHITTQPGNLPSQRVILAAGGLLQGPKPADDLHEAHLLYAVQTAR